MGNPRWSNETFESQRQTPRRRKPGSRRGSWLPRHRFPPAGAIFPAGRGHSEPSPPLLQGHTPQMARHPSGCNLAGDGGHGLGGSRWPQSRSPLLPVLSALAEAGFVQGSEGSPEPQQTFHYPFPQYYNSAAKSSHRCHLLLPTNLRCGVREEIPLPISAWG